MKNTKRLIAMFYVALILLFKVTGLHALSHTDDHADAQHCEVCDITTAVSFTPLLESETRSLPQVEYYFSKQKINNKSPFIVFKSKYLSCYLFTRPPPQFT